MGSLSVEDDVPDTAGRPQLIANHIRSRIGKIMTMSKIKSTKIGNSLFILKSGSRPAHVMKTTMEGIHLITEDEGHNLH